MKRNITIKISLVFSLLALIISVLTFLKTGGVSDIKKQVSSLREDIKDVKLQTEIRMENRSTLFEVLCDLAESVDSLKSGNAFESRRLLDDAIRKIGEVENELSGIKRGHLAKIRMGLEKLEPNLISGDTKTIREFEYQIILLRIFEENL